MLIRHSKCQKYTPTDCFFSDFARLGGTKKLLLYIQCLIQNQKYFGERQILLVTKKKKKRK